MTVRKNNRGKWAVDIEFEHADGRKQRVRKTSPVNTRRGAEAYERDIRHALLAGTYGKQKEEDAPTLAEFRDEFVSFAKSERQKPSGIYHLKSILKAHLVPLFGGRKLNSFKFADEVKLKERLAGRRPATYNNVASRLNSMLKAAVLLGKITAVPHAFRFVKKSTPMHRFYDFDEFEWLVEAAARCDPRIELAILLGGEAGLRRGEIIGLNWSACDLRRGLITVLQSEIVLDNKPEVTDTKGLNYRVVPMTKRVLARLKAFQHLKGERVLYPDPDQGETGTVTSKVFQVWMKRAQKRARVGDKGEAHILRHTFCSHLAMRGAPVTVIQRLAGHQNLTTTMRYMHLAPGEVNRAIALLDDRSSHLDGQRADGNGAATTGDGPRTKHRNS